MSSTEIRQVGGAVALFWAGGNGPSRARIESALMMAGFDPLDGGNKQELVQRAVREADDQVARRILDELVSLLRESGDLDRYEGNASRERLQRALSDTGNELTPDGHIQWSASVVATVVQAGTATVGVSALQVEARGVVESAIREVASPNLELLISSLRRLGTGACRSLVLRRRDRRGITVEDEYDMQDLVECHLRTLYSDVRPEEPTPSSGGSSSRIDLHLRDARTAVEVKVSSRGRTQRQIKQELLGDINDYRGHPTVETLVAVIYDWANVFDDDAYGLERDLSRLDGGLEVRIVVVPWVGPRVPETD